MAVSPYAPPFKSMRVVAAEAGQVLLLLSGLGFSHSAMPQGLFNFSFQNEEALCLASILLKKKKKSSGPSPFYDRIIKILLLTKLERAAIGYRRTEVRCPRTSKPSASS